MCDTLVALPNTTADGSVLFAKNSDRDPNEAHQLLFVPAAEHRPGEKVTCTYVDVPQVPRTHAVLLSKPFWIWGAEIGANDQGVVIGNESVFTKEPYGKEPGLIGMDFLRLALERGSDARQALDTITELLDQYGQGGNCGYQHKRYYHNSFLIADPTQAWVLETSGKHWAAAKVEGFRTISNAITIGSQWDLASDDLVDYAVERGWCKGRDDFDFGRCYSEFLFTRFSYAHKRQCRTTDLLSEKIGQLTPQDMMLILRDHGSKKKKRNWTPARGLFGADICAHAGPGPVRISQTTGSMVSHLTKDRPTHWLTGTSAPCTSVFKPVWFDAGMPDIGPAPGARYDKAVLWWLHETLHREVLRDYASRQPLFRDQADALEASFVSQAQELMGASADKRRAFSQSCFDQSREATLEWRSEVSKEPLKRRLPIWYAISWNRLNRLADLAAPVRGRRKSA
ncbi:MAG: C69 family dipeptidase [Anaerolineales bacterium]|jgi:dipeptidase